MIDTNKIKSTLKKSVQLAEIYGSRLTRMWIKTLSDEFMKTRQKNAVGKTDSMGLFYLYISKSLITKNLFAKGLRYLNEKDLYGETGLQKFKNYLEENL
jgi:hypothetical protein